MPQYINGIVEPAGLYLAGFEHTIEKSDGAVLLGSDDLFVITGGPIMVTEIVGICTVNIGGAANCHLDMVVTTPAGTVAMSTDVAIGAMVAGGSVTFTNVALPVLTVTAAGAVVAAPAPRWLCPIGTIKAHCSAAQTGNIKWYMSYKPLSPNSVVTVAV